LAVLVTHRRIFLVPPFHARDMEGSPHPARVSGRFSTLSDIQGNLLQDLQIREHPKLGLEVQ
jgi:hypothetical protein